MSNVTTCSDQHPKTSFDVQLRAVVRNLADAEAQLLVEIDPEFETAPVFGNGGKRALKVTKPLIKSTTGASRLLFPRPLLFPN